jgi:hypothetical protein
MCQQMKLSKPVFQHVTANGTVLSMSANDTYPHKGAAISGLALLAPLSFFSLGQPLTCDVTHRHS